MKSFLSSSKSNKYHRHWTLQKAIKADPKKSLSLFAINTNNAQIQFLDLLRGDITLANILNGTPNPFRNNSHRCNHSIPKSSPTINVTLNKTIKKALRLETWEKLRVCVCVCVCVCARMGLLVFAQRCQTMCFYYPTDSSECRHRLPSFTSNRTLSH